MVRIKDIYRNIAEKGGKLDDATLDALLWRALEEMNFRSVSGNAALALAFLFVGMSSDFAQAYPPLFYSLFSLVALTIAARMTVMMLIKRETKAANLAWAGPFYLAIVSFASTWGILTATMLYLYGTSWAALIVVLFATGLGGGALANFCIWRSLVTAYLIILFVPSIVISISMASTEGYILTAGLTLYMTYLLIQAKFWNREYWSSRINNELLVIHADELATALETEKRYSTLQQQFISLVSHEFRTPLTIIDGNAQRLIRSKDDSTPEQLMKRGNVIRSAVERMVGLIDTTLYASRLDAGKIKMHSADCDLRKLVCEICQRQSGISPSHDIHLDLDGLPDVIKADATILEHVFSNLLSNAVKYAPDAPQIDVRGWAEDGNCHVSIKDSGLGIHADDMPKMFQRYFRAKTAMGINGTGLGLSVSQEFVEMHGGNIAIESVEGEGSTFTVRLPIGGKNHPN